MIERGIIASSPMWYSHARKTSSVPNEPQKSPMTVALFQEYFIPPNSRAKMNWIAAGANTEKPMRSSLPRVLRTVCFPALLTVRWGSETKRRRIAATPPHGRLI
jgi:hypothetical protein